MSDPYGIDLALSPDGDLVVTPSGGLGDITGAPNCAQALVLRLKTAPGELPLHEDYGSALLSKIGAKALDDTLSTAQVNVELRRVLESDHRFLAARDVQAASDPADAKRMAISFTLELAGGETLLVTDAADPRLDEVAVDDAPVLADFGDDVDLLDGSEVLADTDDELPELNEFLGDETFTDDDPLTDT